MRSAADAPNWQDSAAGSKEADEEGIHAIVEVKDTQITHEDVGEEEAAGEEEGWKGQGDGYVAHFLLAHCRDILQNMN